jgi:hypothetical protein
MMQQRFFKLESVRRRAPLGLRFLDLARGVSVNDGLVVTARPLGASGPRQQAFRSPVSGIYGFSTLPPLGPSTADEQPAGRTDTAQTAGEDLTSTQQLHDWLRADEGPAAQANYCISVRDQRERFLPLALLMSLPREQLVEVPLFSAPARPSPVGAASVRGEVALHGFSPLQPASWSLVIATLNGKKYVGVTDARGMFTLFVPSISALPPLSGSPPRGNEGIDQLTWPLTIEVLYQAKQSTSPLEPPDILSILEQSNARIYDRADTSPVSSITRSMRFGEDLEVKTLVSEQSQLQQLSQLFIEPAS